MKTEIILKNFIDGSLIESTTSTYQEIYDLGKGEVIGKVPFSTRNEVKLAIESAQKDFEGWEQMPVDER